MTDTLPCPNCKSVDVSIKRWPHDTRRYHYKCHDCGMRGPTAALPTLAQDYWNSLPRHDEKSEKPHPDTSFLQFMEATAKLESARAYHNYADTRLELAHIRKRLTELRSQWNPANAILENEEVDMRTKLLHAAEWVVIGRAVTDG